MMFIIVYSLVKVPLFFSIYFFIGFESFKATATRGSSRRTQPRSECNPCDDWHAGTRTPKSCDCT